jgi:hypothetical protein
MFSPHPDKKTSVLKTNILHKLFSLLVFSAVCFQHGNAQSISIGNFSMPDSVQLNTGVDVFFSIQNTSDTASILGNLKLNFFNETSNLPSTPLGGFDAYQFFAPQQERSFNIVIPITPQFFLEGGNTVVIWPSLIGQPVISEDSIRFDLFVYQVNGLNTEKTNDLAAYLIPNPIRSRLSVQAIGKAPMPESIALRELTGRPLLISRLSESGHLDLRELPAGIYLLEMHLPDGKIITRRIVKLAD